MQREYTDAEAHQQTYEEHMCYSDSEQPLGCLPRVIGRATVRPKKQNLVEKRQMLLTKRSSWQRVQKQVQKLRKTAQVLQNIKNNSIVDKKSQRSTSSLDEAYERASLVSLRLGSIGRSSVKLESSRRPQVKNPQLVKLSQDLSKWSHLQSSGVDLIKHFKRLDVKPASSNSKIDEETED